MYITLFSTFIWRPLHENDVNNLGPVARSMVSINQRLIPWQGIGFDNA